MRQAHELAATAEQRLESAEGLAEKARTQQKRAEQHRAVASRLAIEAASADVDAQRAQRAGALQSAVDMHARCERLQQLAGAEDVCMNRAIKQVCWPMSVPNMLGTHIAIQAIPMTPLTAPQTPRRWRTNSVFAVHVACIYACMHAGGGGLV